MRRLVRPPGPSAPADDALAALPRGGAPSATQTRDLSKKYLRGARLTARGAAPPAPKENGAAAQEQRCKAPLRNGTPLDKRRKMGMVAGEPNRL